MKTVQMTLDEDLVRAVDQVSKRLKTTRSAFTRQALRDALARHAVAELEEKHRRGYENYPVAKEEFGDWATDLAWGDE